MSKPPKANQDKQVTIYSPITGDPAFYKELMRRQAKGVDDAIQSIINSYSPEVRGNPLIFPYVKNWPKIAGDERNHGLGVIVLLEDKNENPLGSIDESNIRRWLAEYFGLVDHHEIITIDDNRGIGKRLGLSFNFSFDKDYQKLVNFLLNPKYEDLGKGLEGHPLMVNLDAKRFQQAMVPKIEEAGYKINTKEF